MTQPFCKPKFHPRRVGPRGGAGGFSIPQLCAAYQFPKLTASRSAVVGIISLGGGYKPTDISQAASTDGWHVPVVVDVGVGGSNSPGDAADVENVLDIVASSGAASYVTQRAAQIRMYFAPNSDAGFAAAIARAVADKCDAISISWGASEGQWSSGGISGMQASLTAAKAAGIPVFPAAGDGGSGDGQGGVNADFPASSPLVISMGGTSLTIVNGIASERVWNDGQGGATGGAPSKVFARPAYQEGFNPNTQRGVCDFSFCADPQTGYRIVVDGQWEVIGGTSAAAPLAAGLFAGMKACGADTSDLLVKLYAMPDACFNDITQGNNGSYVAQPRYDFPTGRGTFRGQKVWDALIKSNPVPPPPPPPIEGGPTLAQAQKAVVDSLNASATQWGWLGFPIKAAIPNAAKSLAPLWPSGHTQIEEQHMLTLTPNARTSAQSISSRLDSALSLPNVNWQEVIQLVLQLIQVLIGGTAASSIPVASDVAGTSALATTLRSHVSSIDAELAQPSVNWGNLFKVIATVLQLLGPVLSGVGAP